MTETTAGEELSTYLQDHLAGSAGGLSLAERLAREEDGPPAEELDRIARDIDEDRDTLIELMDRLGVSESRTKQAGAWVGEFLSRLKLRVSAEAGSILRFESLIMGITGKLRLWRALIALVDTDARLRRDELERLESRAADQLQRLGDLHEQVARRTLAR